MEQQPEHELAERVADLVEQDEEEDDPGPGPPEEFGERPVDRRPHLADPLARARLAMACRLADDEPGQHRGQREDGADERAPFPSGALRHDERKRAGGHRSDPPAILRHARSDAELARFQELDPVTVDDDVEGRAGERDQHRGKRHSRQVRGGILDGEIRDGGDDQQAGDDQPGHALPQAAQDRNMNAVDDPRPERLAIIDEEREREGGDVGGVDIILCEARGERRADHRIGKAGRDAEEEGRHRRALEIGPERRRHPAAEIAGEQVTEADQGDDDDGG